MVLGRSKRRKDELDPQEGVAVIVDGDNVPPSILPSLVKLLEREEGAPTERRIYRNWRSTRDSQEWDAVSKELSFERVDRYNTRREGKNASDIAVAVGIMDLLYAGRRSFCLVSGDTDFVPLIERLRRGGCRVLVVGHKGDVGLLEQVSDRYINFSELRGGSPPTQRPAPSRERGRRPAPTAAGKSAAKAAPQQASAKGAPQQASAKAAGGQAAPKAPEAPSQSPPPAKKKALRTLLSDAFDACMEEGRANDEGWIHADQLGKMVRLKDPKFAMPAYGLPASTGLSQAYSFFNDLFEVRAKRMQGGRLSYRVRKRRQG